MWEKGELAGSGNGQSSILGHNAGLQASLSQLSWVYAILLDDSDQLPDASCSPQYPCINPPNTIGPSKGMLTLTASPVMAANDKAVHALHFDPIVQDKRHVVQSLLAKYGNISSLNSAWKSTYTGFESSGTCIGASYNTTPMLCNRVNPESETHGTGSGGAGPYQFTLDHLRASQLSVMIRLNGIPVAGDTPGPSKAYATTDGVIWGPNVTGTIDYMKGVVSISARRVTHPIWRVKGNGKGRVSWYCDQEECGVWPGQNITIVGTKNYNAVCMVLSSPAPTAYTASCQQSGNSHMEVESGSLSTSSSVSGSVVISVDYIANGWGVGSGLMDEDGRTSHNWIGTDYLTQNGQAQGLKMDEDQAIEDLYTQYFDEGCHQIHDVYGMHMMCWGPDSLYRKGVISRYPILRAVKRANAAGDLDAVISQGLYGDVDENAKMILDLESYQGDVPIISGEFWTSNTDSYFSAPVLGTSCSHGSVTVNVTTTVLSAGSGQSGNNPSIGCVTGNCDGHVLTQGMANPNYITRNSSPLKAIESTPTTVTYGPVKCGANGPGGTIALEDFYANQPNNLMTQTARGVAYFNKIHEYLFLDKYPKSGHFVVAGIQFWAYQDNIPEGLNWGWATVSDNAYDGVEDVPKKGENCDSTPSVGNKCGGELTKLGDFIGGPTGAAAANKMWLGIMP